MARVKRAVHSKKHRHTVLERAQGYYGNKSRSFRSANEQVMHSLQYAYRDRRARKGDFRKLWIQRINAAARAEGMSYNRFINGLRLAGVTPQPVLAVAPTVDVPISDLRDATLLMVCAGVADPGNLGTVLRVAEAAGADGVLCCAGSVDVYNPKTVRASAGSLFHIPVVAGGDPGEVLAELGTWGLHRLATRPHGEQLYDGTDLTRRVAVVL